MAQVEFMDFTDDVKGVMESTIMAALEEVTGELETAVARNTKVGKVAGGQLKSGWKHRVRKKGDDFIGEVGNPHERAIWIEFGTGEYALEGKGRKGGWYIPIGSGKGHISQAVADAYGMKVVHGKNGKKFVHTYGIKPQRPLHNAYTKNKSKMIKHLQDVFKGGLS